MKTLLTQIGWQFQLLYRNNLIQISIAVTLLYVAIFYLLKDLPNMEGVLTLLIYNDPAIIGLFFIGLSVIMEKNQRVLSALFVAPLDMHIYLISRILPLSVLGWACALGMAFAIFGLDFQVLHFSVGVFATCVLFCYLGIFIVSRSSEFLLFLLKSIPWMILMSLPLLNYYEVTDVFAFNFLPMHAPLQLILGSYEPSLVSRDVWINYGLTCFWVVGIYALIYKYAAPHIRKGL